MGTSKVIERPGIPGIYDLAGDFQVLEICGGADVDEDCVDCSLHALPIASAIDVACHGKKGACRAWNLDEVFPGEGGREKIIVAG